MKANPVPDLKPLHTRIYAVIRQIPPGKVASYGQIAKIVGGCTARMVGYALSSLNNEIDVPWQRVINAQGKISPHGAGFGSAVQEQLLVEEGVEFDAQGRVNWARVGWPDPDLYQRKVPLPRQFRNFSREINMGYIQDLRKLIGHRPFIMVGAALLILDSHNQLLLQRRLDNGMWGIPGGSLEPGETAEEAVRRETLEETGLTVAEMSLYGVFSGPQYDYIYPNGDQVSNVSIIFLTRHVAGEARGDQEESGEVGYFPLDQLPPDLTPPIAPIVKKFAAENSSHLW